MSDNHSKIRFIGYAIPTTPASMVAIGDPNGPGAVAGTYLGSKDLAADIAARVAVLKNAVEVARAQLQGAPNDASITNVFVAPEFYFHGEQGPYVYADDVDDPAPMILAALATAFPASDYPNWTFVCGSAISAQIRNIDHVYAENSTIVRNAVVEALSKQWLAAFGPLNGVIFDMLVNFIKNCHSYPNMEVRNRALVVSNIPVSTYDGASTDRMTTEKYFVSNEDFILYDVTGRRDVVTEQMTAYPLIDLSGGDLKRSPFDQYAVFRQDYGTTNFPNYMDFAIEICLDHSDVRLRRNIESEPWPLPTDAIHIHLIPSCGMQISQSSVAADKDGFVFNCDGQYALDKTDGTPQQGTLNSVDCVYVNHNQPPGNTGYAAHTQLARVSVAATGNDPKAKTSTQPQFHKLEATDIVVADVTAIPELPTHFAGGPGQIHIYGRDTPFTLYP